jgi:hypothetical protein
MTGTYNPLTATLALWNRDGWFDRPAKPLPAIPAEMPLPHNP